MPLYMDVHSIEGGVSANDVADAHKRDLEEQGKHDVNYVRYWVDEKQGKVFCLSEAPNQQAAMAVHKEAGHPTNEIYEVNEGH